MARTSPRRVEADAQRMREELCELPARHLKGLPVETRIVAHHPGIHRDIVLNTGASPAPAEGVIAFDGDELRALALGAEAERLLAWDFTGFCLLKQHDPGFRVTATLALAGAQALPEDRPWSLGKLLRRLGLEVDSVALAEPAAVPTRRVRAA